MRLCVTVLEIDALGTFNMSRAAFPALRDSGDAAVVNISATLHYGATWYQVGRLWLFEYAVTHAFEVGPAWSGGIETGVHWHRCCAHSLRRGFSALPCTTHSRQHAA